MADTARPPVAPSRVGYEPPAPIAPRAEERSLGDLFRELSAETRQLIQQEVALAKTEASQKARAAGRDMAKAAAGGFVAYAGFVVALVALGLLLGTVMPDWLGLSIVGVVVLLVGYALLKSGMNGLKKRDFALTYTARTLSEDATFVKAEAQEITRDPAPGRRPTTP